MKVKKPESSKVVVSHSQTLRQSYEYQSMECSFGVQLPCSDDPEQIKKTMARAALLVEDGLAHKIQQQRKLLKVIAEANGKA